MNVLGAEGAMCLLCLIGALAAFVVLPALMGGLSLRALRRPGSRWQRALGAVGATLFVAYVAAIGTWVWWVGPWRGGIVAHGALADGREYCVVQTFKGMVEPFQVSFFLRDVTGTWRWHYLHHQDGGWRSAKVTLRDGAVHIDRNDRPFRTIEIAPRAPSSRTELDNELSCPAAFSVVDVAAFHHRRFHDK